MNNMKRNACQKCVFAVRDDNPHCGLRGFRSDFNVEWCESENDKVPNGYELQEDGYFSWVKKKNKYPKTYEECCKVLGVSEFEYNHTGTKMWYRHKLMATLDNLMLCRDAYWKIAGEEMGLKRHWKPDWLDDDVVKHIISHDGKTYGTRGGRNYINYILAFPTEEMRDLFYKNFNKEIEECKEFL